MTEDLIYNRGSIDIACPAGLLKYSRWHVSIHAILLYYNPNGELVWSERIENATIEHWIKRFQEQTITLGWDDDFVFLRNEVKAIADDLYDMKNDPVRIKQERYFYRLSAEAESRQQDFMTMEESNNKHRYQELMSRKAKS